MSFLESALDESRKRGSLYITNCKAGLAEGTSLGGILADNSFAGLDQLSKGAQNLSQHTEQYRHFIGYPYAVIGTIARRISGQQIHVARLLSDEEVEARKRSAKFQKQRTLEHKLPNLFKEHHANAVILEKHPLKQILKKPNPIMSGYIMKFVTIASMELTGKAYWWLHYIRKPGYQTRVNIWPIPSNWLEPIHEDGLLFHHWQLRAPGMGEPIDIPRGEIVYFYHPDPSNPLGATAPLQANGRSIMADEAIEESNRRAFVNGINPGLALIAGRLPEVAGVDQATRPVLTRDQRNALLLMIKQQYRGVQNNEEPLILDGLIQDAKRITNAPREMDFLNSSMATKGRIAQGWCVNPLSMGEIEGANRASSQIADDHFLANCINPRIEMLSEIMTIGLPRHFSKHPEKLIVYIEPAHAVDIDYELAVEQAMVDRAAMSRNEWRKRHNLPPLEEGDSVILGDQEVVLTVEGEGDRKKKKKRPKPGGFKSKSLAMLLGTHGVGTLHDRQQTDAEGSLRKAIAEHMMTLGRAFDQELRDYLRRGSHPAPALVTQIFTDPKWLHSLKQAVEPHLYQIAYTGAVTEWELHLPRTRSEIARIERKGLLDFLIGRVPKDLDGPVKDFMRDLMARDYWQGILETVKERVTLAMTKLVATGHSGMDLADRLLRRTFSHTSADLHASTIARTESTTALNGGHEVSRERLGRLGIVKGRRWVCRVDGKERRSHRDVNGQVVAVDQPFTVGGEQARYPGDPNLSARERCQCRCRVESVTR